MELKEFIKNILQDIDWAFREIYNEKDIVYSLWEDNWWIWFDIFVSLDNSESKNWWWQIKVLNVIEIWWKFNNENKLINSHRITFKAVEHWKDNHVGKNLPRWSRATDFYNKKHI